MFQRNKQIPDCHEGESHEESKASSEFRQKRFPGVDQFLSLNLLKMAVRCPQDRVKARQ